MIQKSRMKIFSNKNHTNQFIGALLIAVIGKKRDPRKKQKYIDEIQREIEIIFQALTSKH